MAFPRKDERTGWTHVDVRMNRDGTFDVLTSFSLTPTAGIGPLGRPQTERIKGADVALATALKVEGWLEEQRTPKKVKK